MMLIRKWTVCAALFVVVAGCSGTTQFIKGTFSKDEPALTAPQRTPVKLPDHAKLAIAGLLQKMRHQTPRGVDFDQKGSHDIVEDFDYSGFQVRTIDIARTVTIKEDSRTAIVDLGGFLHFADKDARATTVGFELVYKLSKKSNQPPVILKSVASNTMPDYPLVAGFIVPAEEFSRLKGKRPETFGQYLQFARRHGLDTRATKEDIRRKKEREGLSAMEKLKLSMTPIEGEDQDLVIMIFCFDRLNPASSLTMTVNNKDAQPVLRDYDGWRVLALGGKGRMFAQGAPFTTDIYYYKDPKVVWGQRKHVGKFSSLKYFPEEPNTRQTSVAHSVGPLEKGVYRLDVAKYNDAVTIQTRLQELGYYKARVDGDFGKGSKAALKAWCKDRLGRQEESMTLAVQQELFKGTGR